MSDDANITGHGAEILLPPQGNPFNRSLVAAEPADLTPSEVEGRFGTLAGPGKAHAPALEDGTGGQEEPADLTPEDIAAMFPASHDERNALPVSNLPADFDGDEEPAPRMLSPDQIAEMVTDAPVEEPSPQLGSPTLTRMGARGPASGPSRDPSHQPHIDINAFNPDQPIGRPKGASSAQTSQPQLPAGQLAQPAAHQGARAQMASRRLGKVDIDAFDPDASVGNAAAPSVEDSSDSLKVDATPLETPVADAPADNTPILTPEGDSQPFPVEGFATPAAASVVETTLAPEPVFAEPTLSSTLTASAPVAGFQPFDPFASSGGQPEAAPQSTLIPSATSSGQSVTTSSVESAATSTQGGVTTETVSSMSAVRREIVTDEDLSGHRQALPTVPMIAFPEKEDEFILNLLVTNDRVEQLWTRIDRAETLAVADENSLPGQREENFENLKAARNLMLGGRKNYEDALRYVMEVESDLGYAGRVRHWSSTWAMGILAYNIFWLALLVFGYTLTNRVVGTIADAGSIDKNFGVTVWLTILSGGLGGVVKSFFSLVTHVTKQDFDTQHRIWYWTSPIIGAVLGIFVIFFSQLGLTSIGTGVGTSLNASLVVFSLAWLIGYNQNILLELVDRVKESLLPDKNDKAKKKA